MSPCSFVWAAAGKHANLEKQVGVDGYGYPAMLALNMKKGWGESKDVAS
uniref:Uncharacterized protein n=1 Tax=Arundo donax TaxID=35708 RepID=A0A0A9GDI6_ARUDO